MSAFEERLRRTQLSGSFVQTSSSCFPSIVEQWIVRDAKLHCRRCEALIEICCRDSSFVIRSQDPLFGGQGHEEVARHLEAQPARRHAGGNLQQVGYYALVKSLDSLLSNDLGHGITDRLVFVAQAVHGVDLKSSAQDVTGFRVSSRVVRQTHCYCTYKGYVQVWATAPETAPASSLRHALGFLSPSGVRYLRTCSYTMKFRPTYGATPATVGTMPL